MKRSKSEDAARRFVLDKWHQLPPEERQTEDQAFKFAWKISHEHELGIARDAYQTVFVWLRQNLSHEPPEIGDVVGR